MTATTKLLRYARRRRKQRDKAPDGRPGPRPKAKRELAPALLGPEHPPSNGEVKPRHCNQEGCTVVFTPANRHVHTCPAHGRKGRQSWLANEARQ